MYYAGQKVVCVDDSFDPGIVEWADHIPENGKTYTVRAIKSSTNPATQVVGDGFHLLELQNPKPSRGGEVCFAEERFEAIEDLELAHAVSQNYKIIREDHKGYAAGPHSTYFKSQSDTGRLTEEEVNYIVQTLIYDGCIVAEIEKKDGCYFGCKEETLVANLIYPSFPTGFHAIQRIRNHTGQDSIGVLNKHGIYIRITEDALLCKGPTYVVYGPSIKVKDDGRFDLGTLGLVRHKEYWIATNLGEGEETSYLPKALREHLDYWEAFSFLPGDDISVLYPKWIESAVSVDAETFLIWHPNKVVTDAGGPYIRLLAKVTPEETPV